MYGLILLALSSFFLSLVLTPLVRNLFQRSGVVDQPDSYRKFHSRPIPRVGGVAITFSFGLALLLLAISPLSSHGAVRESLSSVTRTLPGILVVFLIGVTDDLFNLKPWQKLAGQLIGAGLVCWSGVMIHAVAGYPIGFWSVPVTLLWLVACANAINLIDGVDGLAAGVSLFATLTIFVSSILQEDARLMLATVPLAGALLGFLRYNFYPASVFLGDSGSLTIGFVLGCYGIIWSQKSATLLGITAPLMVLGIPFLDSLLAVARRFLRHRPVFGADRNHIHHRLLDRGLSPRRVVLVLYGICGLAAACSLLQSVPNNHYGGLIVILFCVGTWLGVQQLGYAEFGMVKRLVMMGTFRRILNAQLSLREFEAVLAGARNIEECWSAIRAFSRAIGFTSVRARLGGRIYEEFILPSAPGRCWMVRVPLGGSDYINFSCPFHSELEPGTAALLVESLQKVLPDKIARDRTPSPRVVAVNEY